MFADFATVVGAPVFDRPLADIESNWYELSADESSGRQSPRAE